MIDAHQHLTGGQNKRLQVTGQHNPLGGVNWHRKASARHIWLKWRDADTTAFMMAQGNDSLL